MAEELNLGLPWNNSTSWSERDLKSGSLDFKSDALTTEPHCLQVHLSLNPRYDDDRDDGDDDNDVDNDVINIGQNNTDWAVTWWSDKFVL